MGNLGCTETPVDIYQRKLCSHPEEEDVTGTFLEGAVS
jgi:hypothetical protein